MTGENVLISAHRARPIADQEHELPALDCTIEAGAITLLMGQEHSLCVSYLEMLACLAPPAAGTIAALGEDCARLAPDQQRQQRTRIGFVLRGGPLLSVLNGLENLKLGARYHRCGDEDAIDERARELIRLMPERSGIHRLPAYMNRLQRRLLAISRPLMLQPRILFLDSPFEGLDDHDREQLADFLIAINHRFALALVIHTNELGFARRCAHRILFCDHRQTQVFDDWQGFSASGHATIDAFIQRRAITVNSPQT